MNITSETFPCVIIGSGPAGLSAALALAGQNIKPLILERLDRPALKLLASGGGRCNFSNVLDENSFMQKFGRQGAFMRNALRFAPKEWLLDFFHSHDLKTTLTDSFFYFPASGRARDILDLFQRESGVEIRTCCEVIGIDADTTGVCGVSLADGTQISCRSVILAAGGCAWQGLGTMKGLRLAESLGHKLIKPLPAVAPLLIAEPWVGSLAGVTLPDAELKLQSGRDTFHTRGSLLFTHSGLSGFPALDLAGEAASLCERKGNAKLVLSFCAGKNAAFWENLLDECRVKDGKRLVRSVLSEFLPRSVAETLCRLCKCPEAKTATLSAVSRRMLCIMAGGCELTLTGAGPFSKAMAMRGGISLKEIDPATLQSRLIPGLFFAGEIMDLTGPCGGYNIQWAFSSGRLAGASAADFLRI